MSDLIERLNDESDLCRNDGADDIAKLLDEAIMELQWSKVWLTKAIEFAEEGWGYASDYFKDKWGYERELKRLKLALNPEEQK